MSDMPVIITCAVTGSIHTPSMSPHLPANGEAIARSAIDAARAGAAIVHIHGRDSHTGEPDQSLKVVAPIVQAISEVSDVVINITTGGAATMSIEDRLLSVATLKPELASLNMGSMNFGLYPMLARYQTFAHDWEEPYLAGSRDRIFKNTFADIEKIIQTCAENGTRFEFECYDIGHLYTLAHIADRRLITPPFFIQSVFGILGGIGPHQDDINHMKRTADRLFGKDYRWSALGAGKTQMTIARHLIEAGGHVRVGLEDSLWIGPGELAQTNAQQVHHVAGMIQAAGRVPATPDQARELLHLKGPAGV
ncbi:MAG: 3-keto-5-aminohexanoate cleavage protein [Pseudomonadota bacterium]